jgi:hypothetical protein
VFREAQIHDARMDLHVLATSTIENYHKGMKGSNIMNYVEVVDFIKDNEGELIGAKLKCKLTQD